MSDQPPSYYLARGRSLDAVIRFTADRQAYTDACIAVIRSVGGDGEKRLSRGGVVCGFWFDGPTPDWAKPVKSHPGYIEGRVRSRQGKMLSAVFLRQGYRAWNATDFATRYLGMQELFQFGDGSMFERGVGMEIVGTEYVLSTHAWWKDDYAPPDAERIPTSRYWQLREAADNAAKASP